ncbi:MAG: monofunctional biosynthetic peptidoglycan transglycosylase [Hyphomicrobiaceae bacterium]|nr:monofunctional biosynthetic peptidoglycan transglycosylase [Hyphomicrobiaceae bacterium]
MSDLSPPLPAPRRDPPTLQAADATTDASDAAIVVPPAPAPATPGPSGDVASGPPGWQQWARRAALTLAALLLLPYALTLVYAVVPPPASALMLEHWLTGRAASRDWTPIERISPHLVRSVVVSEDARFCAHWGVDWDAIADAVRRAERRHRPVAGVSTISMQTAKNLYFLSGRSWLRKGLELPLAYWTDLVWSKSRMLEIYLNIAEWGPGIFGAEAAARHHFNKPAAALTAREAALLATALPNPILRLANRPSSRHRALAAIIERRARGADPYVGCLPAARVSP